MVIGPVNYFFKPKSHSLNKDLSGSEFFKCKFNIKTLGSCWFLSQKHFQKVIFFNRKVHIFFIKPHTLTQCFKINVCSHIPVHRALFLSLSLCLSLGLCLLLDWFKADWECECCETPTWQLLHCGIPKTPADYWPWSPSGCENTHRQQTGIKSPFFGVKNVVSFTRMQFPRKGRHDEAVASWQHVKNLTEGGHDTGVN